MEALHGFPLVAALVVVPDAELLESSPPQPAAITASAITTPPSIAALEVGLRDPRLCLIGKIIKPPPVGEALTPHMRSSRPAC
jgi:hypothetical protein